VKFRKEETKGRRSNQAGSDPLAARRSFWIFLSIFSATIFAVSAQMASGYWRYCETNRRAALPAGAVSSSSDLASQAADRLTERSLNGLSVRIPADRLSMRVRRQQQPIRH